MLSDPNEPKCPQCDGLGVYATYLDEVLYWGKKLNVISIAEKRMERAIRMAFDGLLIALAVVGLIWGLWDISRAIPKMDELTIAALLNLKTTGLTVLWISILGDLFIFYRMDRQTRKKHHVKTLTYSKVLPRPISVTFEQAQGLPAKQKKDIAATYTEDALRAVEKAFEYARKFKHAEINPIHLLAALVPQKQSLLMFARLGVSTKKLNEKIKRAFTAQTIPRGEHPAMSQDFVELLFMAYEEASRLKRKRVDVTELLTVIARTSKLAHDILFDLEVDDDKLRNVAQWIYVNKLLVEQWKKHSARKQFKPKTSMNRAMTARPTPTLDSISRDLTLMARSGQIFPLINREKEVSEMLRILEQRLGNVLLVGEAGTGKTIIVEGLAERMAAEDVPPNLQDKRLVSLDTGALVAGVRGQGEIENRMLGAIHEAAGSGNVLMFIDDIANLVGAGSSGGSQDASSILANSLSEGLIQVIGVTTIDDFNMFLKNNNAFMRRFQVVKIEEMDKNAAIQVLEARSGHLEARNKVFFSYGAIESAVDLSMRYIHDRYLPSKALDIIEETAIYTSQTKGENGVVDKEDVAAIVSEKTNVKVSTATADEQELLLNLEAEIHKRVIGQDEAVDMVAEALRRARVELRDVQRPIANFLFVGPTGVGKTELAKTISEVYFGGEAKMIRLDMSEFQDQSALSRLIGAPPGYKGATAGGYLTEAVRSAPFSMVLLDELEKAHPDILNVFLQVMDDGRLTDGAGRTVDFTNTIIIATSNAGTQQIQEGLEQGKALEAIKEELMKSILLKYYRPEFLNRFDGVILFKPLSYDEVVQIAYLELAKVASQLESKGITLEGTKTAVEELAREGFDPALGARPLRRVIQEKVDSALAKFMLTGQVGRRDKVVLESGGKIRIEKAEEL